MIRFISKFAVMTLIIAGTSCPKVKLNFKPESTFSDNDSSLPPFAVIDSTFQTSVGWRLHVSVSEGLAPFTYDWSSLPALTLESTDEILVYPTVDTDFTVVVTDSKGRIAIATSHVHPDIMAPPPPSLQATATQTQIPQATLFANGRSVLTQRCANCHNWAGASTQEASYYASRSGLTPLITWNNRTLSAAWVNLRQSGSGGTMPQGAADLTQAELDSIIQWIEHDVFTLRAQATGGFPPYTYQWSPATSVNSPTSGVTIAMPSASTLYSVIVHDSQGAMVSTQIQVNVVALNPLSVNAGTDKLIQPGQSTTLTASASGGVPPYAWTWSPTTGLSNPTSSSPTASPAQTTQYTVTVEDANHITAMDQVLVTIQASSGPVPFQAADSATLQLTTRTMEAEKLNSVFGPTADSITSNLIASNFTNFGGPCDPLIAPSPGPGSALPNCAGLRTNSAVATRPTDTTGREAYRTNACTQLSNSTATTQYATGLIGVNATMTTSVRPSSAQLTSLFQLFHVGVTPSQGLLTKLTALSTGASSNLNAWKLVLYVLCIDPSHQLL